MPLSQWGGSPAASAPQFWAFPYIYVYTLCCRTIKFDVVTHMKRWLVLGGQPRSRPKQEELQHSAIFGVSIYDYIICVECVALAYANFAGSPLIMRTGTSLDLEQSNSAW